MDHFIEIVLRPDPEFLPSVLMNGLYAKLHRALVAQKTSNIGVSFPDAQKGTSTLGGRLRLHGKKDVLQQLMKLNWLLGMRDHVVLEGPQPIPDSVKYRTVSRVQTKSSPDRLRRRLSRRKGLTWEQAVEAIPNSITRYLDLPYLQITSNSTGKKFRLFIEQNNILDQEAKGEFSTYGLSQNATIPWF